MITLYGQIAHDLREAIKRGTYRPGDTIPPIRELMETYDVARDTVRDAIGVLTREGLVISRRGIGTIVRDITPVTLRYTPATPAQTWATQVGATATDEVLSSEWEPADHETVERLRVDPDSPVLHRVRHLSRNGAVVQIADQWITERVVNAIAAIGIDLSDRNVALPTDLFTLMARAGQVPERTTEVLSARRAYVEEAFVLTVTTDAPVLVTNRTTVDKRDQPVETATFVGAGDRASSSYTVDLNRG